MAGPRATALRVTIALHHAYDRLAKSGQVQIGREMVVAEKSGPWMRVYTNTDIEEKHSDKDEPWCGRRRDTPPISGWMQAKGVVEETTPERRPDADGRGGQPGGAGFRSARPGQRGAKRAAALSAIGRDVPQLAAGA